MIFTKGMREPQCYYETIVSTDGAALIFYNDEMKYLKMLLVAAYEDAKYEWMPSGLAEKVAEDVREYEETIGTHTTLTFLIWLMQTKRIQEYRDLLQFKRRIPIINFVTEDACREWVREHPEAVDFICKVCSPSETAGTNASLFGARVIEAKVCNGEVVKTLSAVEEMKVCAGLDARKIKGYSELKELVNIICSGNLGDWEKRELAQSIYALIVRRLELQKEYTTISDCMRG